jgi:hypothetical protein
VGRQEGVKRGQCRDSDLAGGSINKHIVTKPGNPQLIVHALIMWLCIASMCYAYYSS